MMNPETRERTLTDHVRVAATLPGKDAAWLVDLRGAALERFAEHGYPTIREEDWKYTNVARIERQAFIAAGAQLDRDATRAAAQGLVNGLAAAREVGHWLVFVDGCHVPELSILRALPDGVVLDSLAHALAAANAGALQPYLSQHQDQTVLGDLNTAFMTDGAWLQVPAGVTVEEPIHLLFLATQGNVSVHVHNVLVADTAAHATVVEHYLGVADAVYFTNTVTQIFAGDEASIEHYKLQQESERAFHVAGIHAQQSRDSKLESHSVSVGAALARNDITTNFAASGCHVTLNGLYLAGNRQHIDNHTRVDHRAPSGTSREYYRGVMNGAAHAVFNGKVVVHRDAQKTNAHQANHNLLLSRDAEIDTKPQLEIYADDVECTHGATIGQIDEQQLFYLRSRGIDEGMAHNLLVHAFAHDVIERIRVPSLRSQLEQILFARLPQGDKIRELA